MTPSIHSDAIDRAEERSFRRQVGKRLRSQRIWLELSQDEVAAKAGVTRNFVSAIERGAQGLDAWRLTHVAHALGTTLGWLLGDPHHGTEPQDRPPLDRPMH